MGTNTSETIQSEYQESCPASISRFGSSTDKSKQKPPDYRACGKPGGERRNDAGYDAFRAIHYRATEQSGKRAHRLCTRHAGCTPQHEPPQRSARQTG